MVRGFGLKFWKNEIDAWARMNDYPVLDWPEVCRREGGFRETRYHTPEDAKAHPDTYPGQWYLSDQTDFSIYDRPEYVYSLLFGALNVSAQAYTLAGKRLGEEGGGEIIDCGGTAFTAVRMLNYGATKVYVSNYGTAPQIHFVEWFLTTHPEFKIEIVDHDNLPVGKNVIVSEYLEHFAQPAEEFDRITKFEPKRIFNKSAFCTIAYGHYLPLTIDGTICRTTSAANYAFEQHVRKSGYSIEKAHIFNGRVDIYTKS